jgi:NADPH:quinone reductase-like Zn-dependent oxidoreductase
MKAVYVPTPGQSPQFGELPVPEVTEGTVRIRVKAAGLNPIDNGIAAGMLAQMLPHQYPLVLGRDAAGIVDAVGAGVEHVAVGDAVLGHVLLAPPIQHGTLAEYALLPAAAVVPKPATLDFVTAAALPLAGAAAAQAVEAVTPQSGQTVLVNGASGGVGSFAVQLLAARGVTVVATGTAADRDRLLGLGAARVIDYTTGAVAEQVRAAYPAGVDALVNLAGNSAAEVPLAAVRTGGVVATTTMAPDAAALEAAGLTGSSIMAMPVRETTAPLAEQAAAGTLAVQVAQVVPLDQALDGLAALAAGQVSGKLVVTVGD